MKRDITPGQMTEKYLFSMAKKREDERHYKFYKMRYQKIIDFDDHSLLRFGKLMNISKLIECARALDCVLNHGCPQHADIVMDQDGVLDNFIGMIASEDHDLVKQMHREHCL